MFKMTEGQFFGLLVMVIAVGLFVTGGFYMYSEHSERMKDLEIRQMIVRDSLENLRN